MTRHQAGGVTFAYRTHYEGLLGRRIRHLPDPDVPSWFRRAWAAANDPAVDPRAWVAEQLGGPVYGLASILEEARDHGLPAPATWQDLARLLPAHLYAEGPVRVDAHSVRVRTDDDEVDLAYFFLDDQVVREHPDRLTYLLRDTWPLPGEVDPHTGPFTTDLDLPVLRPTGAGDGATYAVLLVVEDSDTFDSAQAWQLPGVRLPDLATHLRTVTPTADQHTNRFATWYDTWPKELLTLRAAVSADDPALTGALERCNLLGVQERGELISDRGHWLLADHDTAHRVFGERLAASEAPRRRDPSKTRIAVGGHIAQMAYHADDHFGYEQWFLFDDRWAATHPDLAGSLLRHAHTEWDPLD